MSAVTDLFEGEYCFSAAADVVRRVVYVDLGSPASPQGSLSSLRRHRREELG
jgi:hypothetical protein